MWSHSWAFHKPSQTCVCRKSESTKVLSVAAYLCCITLRGKQRRQQWERNVNTRVHLVGLTNKAKSPKSLTSSAKINCHANLWIRGLSASVATQPLETRLVLLKGIYRWFEAIQFALFWGGGGFDNRRVVVKCISWTRTCRSKSLKIFHAPPWFSSHFVVLHHVSFITPLILFK